MKTSAKIHKVSGSIVGVTVNKVPTFIATDLATMDNAGRKAWLLGADGASSGAFTVERLFSIGDGPARLLRFPDPLKFMWTAVMVPGAKGGKRRAFAVRQAELGLSTVADPASLLDDIVFELVEMTRFAFTPAYADNPAYRDKAALVRRLVKVEALAL